MRYKVELLEASETGEGKELFHLVLYAQNEEEAVMEAQKEYTARNPGSPRPPEAASWISYPVRDEDCWG